MAASLTPCAPMYRPNHLEYAAVPRNSERGLRNDRYLLSDRTAWAGPIRSGATQGTALRDWRPNEHNSSVMTAGTTPAEIVTFWREAGPDKWFEPDREFDLTIRSRFFAVYEAAAGGRLAAWQESSLSGR